MKRGLVFLVERLGLKPALALGANVAKVSAGIPGYVAGGVTPPWAYQAMVELYCQTGGYSNDVISGVISALRPRSRFAGTDGVLGNLEPPRLDGMVSDLNQRGYHVFAERLAPVVCDRLLALSLTLKSQVRHMDSALAPSHRIRYERAKPVGTRYDFDESEVVTDPDVQRLMSDLSLLTLAQGYLGTTPALDIVNMWWHTAFAAGPDKAAAQYYHFDMDRVKWLKLFIYLTDVDTDNGPHCFVAGSHRRGRMPRALLNHGYARLGDDEVRRHFADEDLIEFVGPRGTMIAEDTRGLHKGKHVKRGDRLILELEFANTLFGGELSPEHLGRSRIPELAERMREHPRVYRRYSAAE